MGCGGGFLGDLVNFTIDVISAISEPYNPFTWVNLVQDTMDVVNDFSGGGANASLAPDSPSPVMVACNKIANIRKLPNGLVILGDTLKVGQKLYGTKHCLLSPNNIFWLCLQMDGNLVVYIGYPADSGRHRYASMKFNPNLPDANPTVKDIYLILESDGNLVVRFGDGSAWWSSNTAGSGAVMLAMQTDGNLVLYNEGGNPVWCNGDGWSYHQYWLNPPQDLITDPIPYDI